MLRAIIGTAAVLAGFGVLERSVDASTGHAGSCTATQAYALIQRGETVPVRAEPTQQSAVIGTLSGRAANGELARSQVTIMGSQSGWARIALNTAEGYAAGMPRRSRSAGCRPICSRSMPASTARSPAYDRPDLMGSAIATIEGDDMKFRVLGCRGTKLQVVNARLGHVWIDKWCAREEGCRG